MAVFQTRIGGQHLGTSVGRSTLRRTLVACLLYPEVPRFSDMTAAQRRHLTLWMRQHLSFAVAPIDARSQIERVEKEILRLLDPPLNIKDVPRSPLRQTLDRRRQMLRMSARGELAT
jgi:hypothetical protein